MRNSTVKHKTMNNLKNLFYRIYDSPFGSLIIVADQTALHFLNWMETNASIQTNELDQTWILDRKIDNILLSKTELQLKEYFQGKRRKFDIPLNIHGTSFQKKAWNELKKIPYGKTISYQAQAEQIGHPKAHRAVGGANGKNPIGIIIPCHRVIGSNGRLTGFSGGLDLKKKLLQLEKAID